MQKLIKEIPLANGLTFRFFDATRRYFGDYHQVRITISCEVPVSSEHFEEAGEFDAAVRILGPKVQYQKEIEQQGVATDAVAETVDHIVKHFMEHSLGYFESSAFPKKLVHSELKRVQSKGRAFFRPRANG